MKILITLIFIFDLICSGRAYSKTCGAVQSGGTNKPLPITGAKITLYVVINEIAYPLTSTITDKSGKFCISTGESKSERSESEKSLYYVDAELGLKINMITVIGPLLIPFIVINELTTVAASYSFAQFYKSKYIKGDSFGLKIANGMISNVVDIVTGNMSPVLLESPNADETNSLRLTNSLSNLLSACLVDNNVLLSFLQLTDPTASSTSQALSYLTRNPGINVDKIYQLSKKSSLYGPTLRQSPDCWTVTIKINNSGDKKQLIGGPANILFDENGYAWVTNNVIQGTPYSSRILLVFQPNGKPADGRY